MSTNILLTPADVFCNTDEDSGERSAGVVQPSNGLSNAIVEWKSPVAEDFTSRVREVLDRLPNVEDKNRPEEIRTLKLRGILLVHYRAAVVYECPWNFKNLRDVLQTIPMPTRRDKHKLCSTIVSQIRSLHVHFQLQHLSLRTQSIVFLFDNQNQLQPNPYILDWGRPSIPNIYQHPDYRPDPGQYGWVYDVWSLMMVLSEIVEWKPLDQGYLDASRLQIEQVKRKKEVMDPSWQGDCMAETMKYGFEFIAQDCGTLENLTRRDVMRFFDKLSSFFELIG